MKAPPGGSQVRASHRTMAEEAAHQLHGAIVSGEIPAGSHLRLTELAAGLGMSEMPVREALRRLQALGLVDVHPHRGAFVRALSPTDLTDTMEVRTLLERTAVELAATLITPTDADKAGELLEQHIALCKAGLLVEAREVHTDFHFSLYRASGSHWLLHAIGPVWRNSERYRFAHPVNSRLLRQTHTEHLAILDACRAGDPVTAGEALSTHLSRALKRMFDNLGRQGSPA